LDHQFAVDLFDITNKIIEASRLNWLKYLIFLAVILTPFISAIRSVGRFSTIDIFYNTDQGISIAKQGVNTLWRLRGCLPETSDPL
jgi:hypothetical protein